MSTLEEIVVQVAPLEPEPMLPICLTNALTSVFIVHVYAPNGGAIGLGDCYHPSRSAAEAFANSFTRELPRYRCAIHEYARVDAESVVRIEDPGPSRYDREPEDLPE